MTVIVKNHYIKLNETLFESIVADFFSVAFLCGSVWFNQTYCGGSYFLNTAIAIIFMLWLVGKGSAKIMRFKSAADAIAYIKSHEKA